MVPIPVPAGVAPWVTWIFVAIAIGAFVVILIGGIQRYRRMRDEPDDDRERETAKTRARASLVPVSAEIDFGKRRIKVSPDVRRWTGIAGFTVGSLIVLEFGVRMFMGERPNLDDEEALGHFVQSTNFPRCWSS